MFTIGLREGKAERSACNVTLKTTACLRIDFWIVAFIVTNILIIQSGILIHCKLLKSPIKIATLAAEKQKPDK